MNDKLLIKELVQYYIRRYNLKPSKTSDDSSDFQEMYGKYIVQVQRLLQSTPIREKTLWDIIKPGKGNRRISIEDFEKHCFDRWAAYIIKKHEGDYDRTRLEKDMERHKLLTDESYLIKKMENAIDKHNNMIQKNPSGGFDDADYTPFVSDKKLAQKGHEMMLEAIYEIFYESFNWKQLEKDMLYSQIYDDGYNPDVTITNQRSIERLKDYSYYVGKKKF